MPLLGNFAAQSNNRKKQPVCVSGVLPVQVVQRGLFVHLFKHFLLVRRSTTIWWSLFCSIDARASNDDGQASSGRRVKRHCACSSEVFRQIERKERPKRVPPWGVNTDHLLISPDVVSLVIDQTWWNQWIEMSVHGREPATALFCVLNPTTTAGCRWKKFWTRSREENARSSLDISPFCWEGEGRQEETSQSSAWHGRSAVSTRSPITTKRKLRASCPAHLMKFTTTKTRWQISPDLDLCPVKTSSLIQAQKG